MPEITGAALLENNSTLKPQQAVLMSVVMEPLLVSELISRSDTSLTLNSAIEFLNYTDGYFNSSSSLTLNSPASMESESQIEFISSNSLMPGSPAGLRGLSGFSGSGYLQNFINSPFVGKSYSSLDGEATLQDEADLFCYSRVDAGGGRVRRSPATLHDYLQGLFDGAVVRNYGMNLFVQADPVDEADASINLTVFGSTGSGVAAGIDLYLACDGNANRPSGIFPISLIGSNTETKTKAMPFYIRGAAPSTNNDLMLMLLNSQSGIDNTCMMYIKGAGSLAGAAPTGVSFDLFLRRAPAESIDLYMQAYGTAVSGGMLMSVAGGTYEAATEMTMTLTDVVGVGSGFVPLFVSGF